MALTWEPNAKISHGQLNLSPSINPLKQGYLQSGRNICRAQRISIWISARLWKYKRKDRRNESNIGNMAGKIYADKSTISIPVEFSGTTIKQNGSVLAILDDDKPCRSALRI